ncbi:hypothetical protein SERLA73DRAFT_69071 [Serpula lacrymans var. lacrymans S7.3]|uniref:Uncharacterized protein n=2 Tax=Serpula lacrymans var. lacrymans TaxID=341189 RepID=F8PJ08_SERL3|nr:uncharacterized protein SERLADRAFT_432957 [Serpula lacrymans var. lacrymans S7.9]EGO03169.1 hypothetical protein SERLA73DRAFT_69071 [Serpula lacrymans var. lacrymans S7.3]EGO28951.1 hypothetical protein SERLADRAFT_432957 [Serpula lacrymans var. lacrymans S7.9]
MSVPDITLSEFFPWLNPTGLCSESTEHPHEESPSNNNNQVTNCRHSGSEKGKQREGEEEKGDQYRGKNCEAPWDNADTTVEDNNQVPEVSDHLPSTPVPAVITPIATPIPAVTTLTLTSVLAVTTPSCPLTPTPVSCSPLFTSPSPTHSILSVRALNMTPGPSHQQFPNTTASPLSTGGSGQTFE